MNNKFGLQGVEELSVKFATINYDLRFKGGRFALRKSANIIVNSVKSNANAIDDTKTKEAIYKNITTTFGKKRFNTTGDLMFRVGVLGGARMTTEAERRKKRRKNSSGLTLEDLGEIAGKGKDNPGGDTFYWRFVEFGTQSVAARPFMRPALESNVGTATNEFVTQYKKSLDRAIKKASKETA
jgi:HK97 gp10 family phage protein